MKNHQRTEAAKDLATPVYYQPVHEPEMHTRIAAAFARRGYAITTDEDALEVLSILVEGGGEFLTISWGDLGSILPPVGEYESPEEYVTAAADWFESDLEDDAPAEPGAAARAEQEREQARRDEWIAGMRELLDMLDAQQDLPLPHFAKDKVAIYTRIPLQSARIARELEGYEIHDRPGHIWRYETTGRLRGLDVAVYVGDATGVAL